MNARKSSIERKAEILTATLELAFEVGPDHVTTGMIAGRLGLTQPAIYKHYPKKGDVWLAASETLSERIRENTLQGSLVGKPPLDNLRRLVLGHLLLVTDVPTLPEIMVARDSTGALNEARHIIQEAIADFRTALTVSLERARTAGQFRADLCTEDGAMLVFGIIQSLILRLIISRDPTFLVQDGARLLDLQLSLFLIEGNTI
jgi:AcrR family transcriptional regulator